MKAKFNPKRNGNSAKNRRKTVKDAKESRSKNNDHTVEGSEYLNLNNLKAEPVTPTPAPSQIQEGAQHRNSLAANANSIVTSNKLHPPNKKPNKKRKVTIMVILVTVNFAICWLPTHLFIIIKRSVSIEQNSDAYIYLSLFKIIAHTLSYLTPVINPCLYAFFNENFRSSFHDLWLMMTCRYKVN